MAKTQRVMWTALPNGIAKARVGEGQILKMSIFVSPQLGTDLPMGYLADFPDFDSETPLSNWAATISAMQFDVEFGHSVKAMAPHKVRAVKHGTYSPEPALWDSVFGPQMPIKQFKFIDISKTKFTSFSSTGVFNIVKTQYGATAAIPKLVYALPDAAKLVKLPGVVNPPLVHVLPTPLLQASPGMSAMAAGNKPVQAPAFRAFEEFHVPYEVADDFEPPPIPEMDFHKACTALGNYPALMRRLGLVIDVEIPYTSTLAGTKFVRVIPVWADARPHKGYAVPNAGGVVHSDVSQWTAMALATATRTKGLVKTFWPTARDAQVQDGYMVVRKVTGTDPTKLLNVDVDLAATRLMATAVQIRDILDMRIITPPIGGFSAQATAVKEVEADTVGLPGLGQPVIRFAVADLGDRVKKQAEIFKTMNDNIVAGQEDKNINYAEDLNRGYRVDVWDDVTRIWHSLCQRTGTYHIGDTPITWGEAATHTDEGWIQLSAISAPQNVFLDTAPSEMRIHEALFDWTGWSLAVPRPGNTMSEPDETGNIEMGKTFVDPEGNVRPVGKYLHPLLPLDATFSVPAGSLPRLRFGVTYRFRARTVDLAGNSIAFSKGTPESDPGGASDKNTLVTRAITHKRYDPVKPPDVVMAETAKQSESPHIVVVRTYTNPLNGFRVTEPAIRHITPPRIAVSMAEALGGLDSTATPDKPMDRTLWSTLCERDLWEPPKDADGAQVPQATIPSPVRYLPDMFSRGAALSNLPGVANYVKVVKLGPGATISGVKVKLSGSDSDTVATTRVAFDSTDGTWFNRQPFDLSVAGVGPLDTRVAGHDLPEVPQWRETERVLGVQLPQAEELTVGLSSYASPFDLTLMGVYQWGLESFVPALKVVKTPKIPKISAASTSAQAALAAPVPTAAKFNKIPTAPSTKLPLAANTIINAALIGQNWMLTPQMNLTFVHAVDKPLITPTFTSRAHFERKQGETHATLIDWLEIHGKSTSKLDIKTAWTENVDDPSAGAPKWGDTAVSKSAHAFSLTVDKTTTRMLEGGRTKPTMKTVGWGVIPKSGMFINDPGSMFVPQRQYFGDTKHRKINVSGVATSRFEKYFSDLKAVEVTATTETPKVLHVPSSARPPRPEIAYIVPTFGWTRSGTTSTRTGGGLRVYLKRPWFATGDDELLGVVMWKATSGNAGFSELTPYVTHWGKDPLYVSRNLPSTYPTLSNFKRTTRTTTDARIPEYIGHPCQIAGYAVDYDSVTGMWFADIVIDAGKAYLPFIKLALCRYQPCSLFGIELSPVSVADFVQLTPDRQASVAVNASGNIAEVTLTGHTYFKNYADELATVTATIERTFGTWDSSLASEATSGWTAITDEVELSRSALSVVDIVVGSPITWRSRVPFTNVGDGAKHRVVIREYEWFKRFENVDEKRLVFVESINLSV